MARFFVLPMVGRRRCTLCTARRLGEYRVGKMSRIFRPADGKAAMAYFLYVEPI